MQVYSGITHDENCFVGDSDVGDIAVTDVGDKFMTKLSQVQRDKSLKVKISRSSKNASVSFKIRRSFLLKFMAF